MAKTAILQAFWLADALLPNHNQAYRPHTFNLDLACCNVYKQIHMFIDSWQ